MRSCRIVWLEIRDFRSWDRPKGSVSATDGFSPIRSQPSPIFALASSAAICWQSLRLRCSIHQECLSSVWLSASPWSFAWSPALICQDMVFFPSSPSRWWLQEHSNPPQIYGFDGTWLKEPCSLAFRWCLHCCWPEDAWRFPNLWGMHILYYHSCTLLIKDYIFWLDIAMNDHLGVQVIKC